jgi:phosphoadenosine phosphosulfate reductase
MDGGMTSALATAGSGQNSASSGAAAVLSGAQALNAGVATHHSALNGGSPLSLELQQKVAAAHELLIQAIAEFGSVTYSNSLGAEAMVLTDLIWSKGLDIEIFSIDTGRLHEETYSLLDRVQRRYGKRIKLYYPDAQKLETYVARNGINGFYNGLEERMSCCHIRKVEPFRRAIAGRKAWVTGVRREQSSSRAEGSAIEWDAPNGLYKVSPLLGWTQKDIWDYIHAYKLPYNPLHDRNYPSIGCAPCTRAIEPGQDSRAGRWWWEHPDSKECGLHPRVRVAAPAT